MGKPNEKNLKNDGSKGTGCEMTEEQIKKVRRLSKTADLKHEYRQMVHRHDYPDDLTEDLGRGGAT